ncbi:tryptophan 2,3-dioxygenase [Neptunicoccus cionae]|uniref:Tryptophan 2,3-dioxygenase n=1 Tax=Neptunicoccus cionae TaxID=2035344 RepID=A0A916QSX0_9RHOB|nr:tryptophan 2,3-dioxygenase [Amylibacter cionae]GGA07615.1 tryptophan 2,3-dioxygenase [Amylibacter cionae]
MANGVKNPADEATLSFKDKMSYTDYLGLDAILTAQHPLSDAHDEMLFIVQHQASEVWLRLAIYELNAARDLIAQNETRPAFKMLTRVARIFEQLNSAWDVLRTMTPSEYTQFRDALGHSSGFQSHQYRLVEYLVGNRNHTMLKPHEHRGDLHQALVEELAKPSLYDVVLRHLAQQGFAVPSEVLERDVSVKLPHNDGVQGVWKQIYQDPQEHWLAYELAEKLVDFEDYFRRWRFNHVTTVERIIGNKKGTGGTGGVSYLQSMLKVELFPELWSVRTVL